MSDGKHKKKEDPTRMIRLRCDYRRDLHLGNTGCFFTIRLHPLAPALSHFEPGVFMPQLTPLGEMVKDYFMKMQSLHPEYVRIDSYVFMPDHVHICFYILKESRQTPLQYLVAALNFSNNTAQKTFAIPQLWNVPGDLWVCYSREMYSQKNVYTRGNIARWHMDHEEQTLSHPHRIRHPRLNEAYPWECYGNIALLDENRFLPCYISRAMTPNQIKTFTRLAITLARENWVLVGGFVSPSERQLLDEIREAVPQPRIIQVAATKLNDKKLPARLADLFYKRLFLRLTGCNEIFMQKFD